MHEFARKYSDTCFFVLSNLHLQGFRTGSFDELRYKLLECHKTTIQWLLQLHGYCDLVRWTVIIGAMLKTMLKNRVFAKKCTYEVL